ncbi:Floral homeotic protein like [Actinidia chinensis var. chinensis]|uniref:Floral homeotic protein like n=1 Tax=Actinidia chinensis var. chinensis TaxID=1590841 RepID=A0A2R6RMT5_ACTCC|nr:Floral homeotic protein like [Actinidia chinensis var. chinensis]
MARGKIQIKRIENSTNRQVTYSKRRSGLFKKANELTVLCDAKVSIIMLSSTGKLHEYISPSVATKQLFDQYQKTLGIDLWSSRYEKMQEHLKKLKHVNRNLRREIRQRMGESLNELSYEDLHGLELDVETSLKIIRDRNYKVISNQIATYKKKLRNVEEIHRSLIHEFDAIGEDSHYGLVDNEGDYDSVLAYSNGDHGILALRLQPNHHSLHAGAGLDLTTYALLE